jgi:hypothetical protein
MQKNNQINFGFAALLIGIPAIFHLEFAGSYIVDPHGDPRTFWIGPISTTLPFVGLAAIFLRHCARATRRGSMIGGTTLPAYAGAATAWMTMMSLSLFLTSQTPGPSTSSTMGIAVLFTPLFYVPPVVLGYPLGAIAGQYGMRRRGRTGS